MQISCCGHRFPLQRGLVYFVFKTEKNMAASAILFSALTLVLYHLHHLLVEQDIILANGAVVMVMPEQPIVED